MSKYVQCCQYRHQTSSTYPGFKIYKSIPPPPFFLELQWACQFCLCLFLSLEATLVFRIQFIGSVSLLSAGGAQSEARLPGLQSLARNAGEMAQLINFQPLKVNSTQDLFMLVIDHSWRTTLCRLEMGVLERRMVEMKMDHCPNSSFLLQMLSNIKRSYVMMHSNCAFPPVNFHPSVFET